MTWRWLIDHILAELPQTRRMRAWRYSHLGPGRLRTKKENKLSQQKFETYLQQGVITPNQVRKRWEWDEKE